MKKLVVLTLFFGQFIAFGQEYVGHKREANIAAIRESFKDTEGGIDIIKSSSSTKFDYYIVGQSTYKQMYDKDSICTSELIEIKSVEEAKAFEGRINALENCEKLSETKWKYARPDGMVMMIVFKKSANTSYCTIKEFVEL